MRQLRHFRGLGLSPACRPEPGHRLGGLRTGHVAFAIGRNLGAQFHQLAAGALAQSPPPTIKFRVRPGFLLRLCLGSRFESPSPVPRNCRCRPGCQSLECRLHMWRSSQSVRRLRRAALSGPPLFVHAAVAPPLARGRLASQASISRAGQRTARAPTWIGSGNEPSRIFR